MTIYSELKLVNLRYHSFSNTSVIRSFPITNLSYGGTYRTLYTTHTVHVTRSNQRQCKDYKQSDHVPHSPPTGRTFTFSPVKPKYDALYHDCISSSPYGPNTCPCPPVESGTFHLYSYLTSADGGTHERSTLPADLTERTSSS
jgi:hypothetical protein